VRCSRPARRVYLEDGQLDRLPGDFSAARLAWPDCPLLWVFMTRCRSAASPRRINYNGCEHSQERAMKSTQTVLFSVVLGLATAFPRRGTHGRHLVVHPRARS